MAALSREIKDLQVIKKRKSEEVHDAQNALKSVKQRKRY
jgi:hypothetical protein